MPVFTTIPAETTETEESYMDVTVENFKTS